MNLLEDNLMEGTGAAKGAPPMPSKPSTTPKQPKPSAQEPGMFGRGLRVSLMPTEEGGKGPSLGRGLLIFFFVAVIEALLVGGGYLYLRQIETAREAELADLLSRRETIVAEIGDAEDGLAQLASFTAQASAVEDSLDAHVYWTSFFEHLADVTMPNVRYMNFSGDAESGTVSLSAIGRSYRDVAEQIVVLRQDPLIKTVSARSAVAKVDELGTVVGVTFSLVLEFGPDAWKPALNGE